MRVLLDSEISIKDKRDLICGLELADMLALPAKWGALHENGVVEKLSSNFTLKVIGAIRPKHYKNPAGSSKRLI